MRRKTVVGGSCVYKSLRSVVKYFVIGLDTRCKDEKPKIQNLSQFSDSSFLVNCDTSGFLNNRGTEFVTFTSFFYRREQLYVKIVRNVRGRTVDMEMGI